jgi:hypothetical protein
MLQVRKSINTRLGANKNNNYFCFSLSLFILLIRNEHPLETLFKTEHIHL